MTDAPRNTPAVLLRTGLYYLAWAVTTIPFLALLPLALLPVRWVWPVLRVYFAIQIQLLRWICGIDYRISGREHLPDGPVILASRHDALWETVALPYEFDNPVVFLKEEILRWPVVGLVVRRLGHVAVRRQWSPDAMRADIAAVRDEVAAGRSVLIFPSGTRNPARRFEVQTGVAVLYRSLGIPCVPVVLDSVRVWPHRSWRRLPGTVNVRLLPAIEPGLSSREFVAQLSHAMRDPPEG